MNLIRQRFSRLCVHGRRRNDDELIATEPSDHVRTLRDSAKPFGQHFDEPITGGMAKVIIDCFHPVEVEEQGRDRSRLFRSKSGVEVRQERSAIVQSGQIIVFGQEPKLLFRLDTRLNLREQRSDCLERVKLLRLPLPVTELDETQHARGDVS